MCPTLPPPIQINNPDMRVVILKDYVKTNFPASPLLDYAMEVEKITTSKVRLLHDIDKSSKPELVTAVVK